jgi:galactose oxidase-like protein
MSERWLWTQKEDIGPSPRGGHALAYDAARQRVVLFGGSNALGSIRFNDTWEWDGAEWTQIADTGPPRRRHGMVFESSRECLVLFGGEGGSVDLFDTWEWSDLMWAKRQDMGRESASPREWLTPETTRCSLVVVNQMQRGIPGNGTADCGPNARTWALPRVTFTT